VLFATALSLLLVVLACAARWLQQRKSASRSRSDSYPASVALTTIGPPSSRSPRSPPILRTSRSREHPFFQQPQPVPPPPGKEQLQPRALIGAFGGVGCLPDQVEAESLRSERISRPSDPAPAADADAEPSPPSSSTRHNVPWSEESSGVTGAESVHDEDVKLEETSSRFV
jgi:hypothetical protein